MKKSLLSFLLMLCCLIGMTTNAFAATSALAAADEEETSWTDWSFTIDDWKALGQGEETWPLSPNGNYTGSYTYACIWIGTDDNVLVSYRVSLTDPTKAQFRIGTTDKAEQERFPGSYLYWAANAELIIDCTLGNDESGNTTYTLTVESQYTGYENGSHGSLFVADAPNMYNVFTSEWPDKGTTYSYEKNPLIFDPVKGIFTLNLVYYTPDQYIWQGTETFVLDGYVRYDYSMSLTYISGTDSAAVVNFEKGADVASFKYAVVDCLVSGAELDSIANGIADGTIAATECTEDGEQTIALSGYGEFTVVACSYDSEGQFQGSYSTSFTIEDPTEWVSLGMVPYVDDIVGPLFGEDPVEYMVEVQANTKTPGVYRMVNPYGENYPNNFPGDWDASKNYYLIIDATNPEQVFFYEQNLGVDWGYGGFMFARSLADYYISKGYSVEDVAGAGYFGKFENGIITFPKGAILLQPGNGNYYPVNSNSAFKLDLSSTLPRDYSMTITYLSNTDSVAIVNFEKGEDVASFKYVVVEGTLTQEVIDSIANGITDGTIAATECTEDGEQTIAMSGYGMFTVVACAYDSEGQCQGKYSLGFKQEYPDEWESLGMFTYVDDIVSSFFDLEPAEYQVEVEVNAKVPGLYRIKNPYGENYPHSELGNYDTSKDYYLVIDATNPEQVFFYEQNIGLDCGLGGFAWITSYAGYMLTVGYSVEEVAGMNLFGKLENGIITFPTTGMLIDPGNGNYYFVNNNGAFKLDLNVVDAINNVTADKKVANDAYYNLNGVKVAHPTKGIYIKDGKKVFINK